MKKTLSFYIFIALISLLILISGIVLFTSPWTKNNFVTINAIDSSDRGKLDVYAMTFDFDSPAGSNTDRGGKVRVSEHGLWWSASENGKDTDHAWSTGNYNTVKGWVAKENISSGYELVGFYMDEGCRTNFKGANWDNGSCGSNEFMLVVAWDIVSLNHRNELMAQSVQYNPQSATIYAFFRPTSSYQWHLDCRTNNETTTDGGCFYDTTNYPLRKISVPGLKYNSLWENGGNGWTLKASTGYHFVGWYTGENTSTSTLVTADMNGLYSGMGGVAHENTYYAHFASNEYTVNFDSMGGTGGTTEATAKFNQDMPAITRPRKTGYDFAGYYAGVDGSGKQYYNANGSSASLCDFTNTKTLYAKWTLSKTNLYLNAKGGTFPSSSEQLLRITQTYNSSVYYHLPSNYVPSRTGYSFTGYYDYRTDSYGNELTPVKIYSAGSSVDDVYGYNGTQYWSSNTWIYTGNTLYAYAHWDANRYTVYYHPGGGNGTDKSASVLYNQTFNIKTRSECGFTRPGYEFLGWSTIEGDTEAEYNEGQEVSNLTSEKDGIVHLYAVWKPHTYKVMYYPGSGTGTVVEQRDILYGQSFYLKTLSQCGFYKLGYNSLGWSTTNGGSKNYNDGQLVSNLTTAKDGVVRLYPDWDANRYTVYYHPAGGVGADVAQPVRYDNIFNLKTNSECDFKRVGYEFLGWSTVEGDTEVEYNEGQQVSNLTSGKDGTVDLYAVWAPHEYTINYYNGGGNGSMLTQPMTYDVRANLLINNNHFTKIGHSLTGWATVDGGAKEYDENQEVFNLTSDKDGVVNLYAVWEPSTYVITLFKNDGTSASSKVSVTYGTTLPIITPLARVGYLFDGYSTSGGSKYYYCDGRGITYTNVNVNSLYANWIPIWYSTTKPAGEGSEDSPYKIVSASDLAYIATLPSCSAYCVQLDNIDLSSKCWTGINNFSGTYDAQGFVISGLKTSGRVKRSGAYMDNTIGLFNKTTNAKIKNVMLTNGKIYGEDMVGGIVANANGGIITNCKFNGNIYGKTNLGGIVGYGTNMTISSCISLVNIYSNKNSVGGILGFGKETNVITNCMAKSLNVSINGGIVGGGKAHLNACGFNGKATNAMGVFSGTIKNCVAFAGSTTTNFSRTASVTTSLSGSTWIGGEGNSNDWHSVNGQLLPYGLVY